MAAKEGRVVQQIELSSLNLPQLMQLKQQLDQVFIKFYAVNVTYIIPPTDTLKIYNRF
jgi:hypothetical protein